MVSTALGITQYLHCKKCMHEYFSTPEIRTAMSPKDYSELSVGFTKEGVQVWCDRHECNVVHIDFQGVKHPANVDA